MEGFILGVLLHVTQHIMRKHSSTSCSTAQNLTGLSRLKNSWIWLVNKVSKILETKTGSVSWKSKDFLTSDVQTIQPIPKSKGNQYEKNFENLGTPHEVVFFYGNLGKIFFSATAKQKMLFYSPMKFLGNWNQNFELVWIESAHSSSAQSTFKNRICPSPPLVNWDNNTGRKWRKFWA